MTTVVEYVWKSSITFSYTEGEVSINNHLKIMDIGFLNADGRRRLQNLKLLLRMLMLMEMER